MNAGSSCGATVDGVMNAESDRDERRPSRHAAAVEGETS
jgi:hypothetical protein